MEVILNGEHLYFDIMDADCAERWEKAYAKFSKRMENEPEHKSMTEKILWNCENYKCLFTELFGPDEVDGLVDHPKNFGEWENVFMQLVEQVGTQSEYANNRRVTFGERCDNIMRQARHLDQKNAGGHTKA